MTEPLIPFGVALVGIVLLLAFAGAWMAVHPEDDEVER